MLPKSAWQHLIPHAGAMCLLDEVLDRDAMHLRARSAEAYWRRGARPSRYWFIRRERGMA